MRADRYKKRRVVPQRHQTRLHPLRQSLHRSLTSSKGAQSQGQASVPSITPHPVGSSPHEGATTAFESSDDFEPRASNLSKYAFQYYWRMTIGIPYLQPVDPSTPTFGSWVPDLITVSNRIMAIGFSWASDFRGRVYFLLVCLETRDMLTIHPSVYFLSRQRVLLRNRRGLSHGQIQPYRLEHGGSILSICVGSSHGRL